MLAFTHMQLVLFLVATEAPHAVVAAAMVAEIDMVAAIVTAEETATEAETATEVAAAAMAAQGATAAAVVVTGADRLVRTGAAAVVEAVVTGRAPGPTPHVSQPTEINFVFCRVLFVQGAPQLMKRSS